MQTLPHPPFPPGLGPTMSPTSRQGPASGVHAPTGSGPGDPATLVDWLDDCEKDLMHPSAVTADLRRAGWHPANAVGVSEDYRRRFNEHNLAYAALLVSTGLTALAAGTTGHLIVRGLDHVVNRGAVAFWLTVLVCSLPFAAWHMHGLHGSTETIRSPRGPVLDARCPASCCGRAERSESAAC